jgi:hypothetical protein
VLSSTSTPANLKVLSAPFTGFELIAFGHGTCKLKPNSRKQIRQLDNAPRMMARLELSLIMVWPRMLAAINSMRLRPSPIAA